MKSLQNEDWVETNSAHPFPWSKSYASYPVQRLCCQILQLLVNCAVYLSSQLSIVHFPYMIGLLHSLWPTSPRCQSINLNFRQCCELSNGFIRDRILPHKECSKCKRSTASTRGMVRQEVQQDALFFQITFFYCYQMLIENLTRLQ